MATLVISQIEKSSGEIRAPLNTRGVRAFAKGLREIPLREIPNPVLFAGFVHPSLRIEKPFSVLIHNQTSHFTAEVSSIEEFGVGSSVGEALEDLGKTLGELYFSLGAERLRLSPDLQNVLAILQDHLREIR
jgi:hypothetical protein